MLKGKRKIRTIRIWLWVVASLFAATFFLSQCAMSKPRAKAMIIESCIKNVPFAPQWQDGLKASGLEDKDGGLVAAYCGCMWDKPLDRLSQKQLDGFAKLDSGKQLELLGGADAFRAQDKKCMAALAETADAAPASGR
ncbi:MAG: hypothetical protein Q3966_03770 [Neisseria sp.]|nr:hypothetical protein [Neisseria sp.]